ncbi:MAG: hypothetical protein AB1656_05785 [Candidatus Omnitrophota bacterium]
MKTKLVVIVFLSSLFLIPQVSFSVPADSPQAAGIVPVTGDLTPWRDYGVDMTNFDNVWAIALNNGNIVVFKRAHDYKTPGVVGGTEFLIFGPDGKKLTPEPIRGSFDSNGQPTPLVNYAATGLTWGAFTLGARPDRAKGTGFIVHNQIEAAASLKMEFGDVMGDEPFSVVQLFDNDGKPVGSHINAFGDLLAESGPYRDIGAVILSNGDIVSLGENRQSFDSFLATIGAQASEVAMAIILGNDGNVKYGPFAMHTGEDGQYLGGSTSIVYENIVAFDGGFVVDYGQGIRWYNNDGSPRTPAQSDHAELAGVEVVPDLGIVFGADTGGRGDGMAIASNGKDLVVKSTTLSSGTDQVGVLIYYKTDGTVRNWVRFDDVDTSVDIARVDRTFCDMDENGNVFVVWQDERFGGEENDGYKQIFGRFFNSQGEPAGPSFPVFENWKKDPVETNYGSKIGDVPAGDHQQPRCAINGKIAVAIDGTTIMPDLPDTVKLVSDAFYDALGDVFDEAIMRIFQNPFAGAPVEDWELY